MSAGPYTADLIARFNRFTHFPKDLATENQRFQEWAASLEAQVVGRLERYGVDGIPEDVAAAIEGVKRAEVQWFHRYVRAREIAPPVMVVGSANYHKHARPAKADKCLEVGFSLVDQAKERLERVVRRYAPNRAISSDAPDAPEQLAARIATLEAEQERMKRINAAHKKMLKDPASLDRSDLTDAEKALVAGYKPAYSWEPHPIAPFQLTNNSANIRRLKARLAVIQKRRADVTAECEFPGGRAVDNVEENRLQLFFEDKPSAEVRDRLKGHGFRWAPSVGAWQRQRSRDAIYWAGQVVGQELRFVAPASEQAEAPEEEAFTLPQSPWALDELDVDPEQEEVEELELALA